MALPLLLFCACSAAPPVPAARPVPSPPSTVKLVFDFTRVFGGRSSSSMFDARVIDKTLMQRVMLEADVFDDAAGTRKVEDWTRHRLMEALGQRHALVIAPPLPASLEPRSPCPAGGCYSPAPTAVLRNLHFLSGQDDVRVRVEVPVNGRVTLAFWDHPGQPSLCGDGFKLKFGFVELKGLVTRVSDGAVAASLSELVLLGPPRDPTLTGTAPDPAEDPAAFCRYTAYRFEHEPDFARDDGRYELAAAAVLESSLLPLFPGAGG